jgi:hypothetical protein
MRAIITRFAGSVNAGQYPWLAACVVAFVVGMGAAYYLDRAGHRVVAILVTALTGLLLSPISWDHHWVWVAPGVAVAGHYALKYRRAADNRATDNGKSDNGKSDNGNKRRALVPVAVGLVTLLVFAPWPDSWWQKAHNLGNFSYGFLWSPPNTNPQLYSLHGDQPWFVEYHWHGLEVLAGNAYILFGMVLMLALGGIALKVRRDSISSPSVTREETAPHMLAQ